MRVWSGSIGCPARPTHQSAPIVSQQIPPPDPTPLRLSLCQLPPSLRQKTHPCQIADNQTTPTPGAQEAASRRSAPRLAYRSAHPKARPLRFLVRSAQASPCWPAQTKGRAMAARTASRSPRLPQPASRIFRRPIINRPMTVPVAASPAPGAPRLLPVGQYLWVQTPAPWSAGEPNLTDHRRHAQPHPEKLEQQP